MTNKEIEIVLCIPGPWADRSELGHSILKNIGGYIFAGKVLMHLETKEAYKLEFCNKDEQI